MKDLIEPQISDRHLHNKKWHVYKEMKIILIDFKGENKNVFKGSKLNVAILRNQTKWSVVPWAIRKTESLTKE